MTPPARQLAATAILIAGLAGCGSQPSGGTTSNAGSHAPAARRDQPANAQHELKPVSPGAPGSVQAVLYRFATLYASVSADTAPERQRALGALAADGLAAQLHAIPRQATLAAARGLPAGAKQIGTVTSLQLAPAHGDRQTGVVILSEQLSPNPTSARPTPVVYTASLARTQVGWRVTSFQPLISNANG
jgi:hypothetical protein